MSKGGSDPGSDKYGGSLEAPKSAPHYWSYRALQEDKKRCLTDMAHEDHTLANTLCTLHSGKDHLSNKGIEEKKKGHKELKNMNWRRESEKAMHPFAEIKGENGMPRFFSQKMLADAKRKLKTNLHVTRYGEGMPKTARESRRSDQKAGSRTGSMTDRSALEEDMKSSPGFRSGAMSPTMTELLEGGDEVHSVLSWWGTVRENRSSNLPHTSFSRFDIKKRHHTTGLNQCEGSPVKGECLQRDPKNSAYQGDYPRGYGNHTFEEPEFPSSTARYQSHADFSLDKGRHSNFEPTDKRHLQRSMGGELTHPIEIELQEGTDSNLPNFTGSKNQYRSNFTLQMHKKKHLAELHSQPLRYTTGPVTPGIAFTPDFKVDNNGVKNEQSGGEISDRQLTSQREMAYCKRFNTVSLNKDEKPGPGWHPEVKKLKSRSSGGSTASQASRSDISNEGSRTPPHPAARSEQWVTSRQIGAEVARRARQLASGRTPASLISESASDVALLHSSQQELAHRKGTCQTNIRHCPSSGAGSMGGSASDPTFARYNDRSSSDSFQPKRKTSGNGMPLKSNSKMEYQKRIHRFRHDDPRRKRPEPVTPPIPPTPRSGQWTPAHI